MTTPPKKFYTADDGEILGFFLSGAERLPVVFTSRDRGALALKMDAWWATEAARVAQAPIKPETGLDLESEAGPGRGKLFVGTRWMAAPTGERLRVPAAEVAAKLAAGWVFRGPRSA